MDRITESFVKGKHLPRTEECGMRVRDFLLKTGLTIPQIIRQTGLTESTVRRAYYNGEASMDTVYTISDGFKVPAEHFFVGTPNEKDKEFEERVLFFVRQVPLEARAQFCELVSLVCKMLNPS